jgi:hypothetical protein
MGKNVFCLAAMLFIYVGLSAQFNESFSDGNFTANPVWAGNVADWQVVASSDVAAGAVGSNTLRLNVATGSGSTYLSTQLTGSWGLGQSWAFFVGRRAQAYTAANHTFIWLWCSQANLLGATASGYRIRIGDDAGGDELVLQKVVNGVATDILTSAGSLTNGITDVGFLLRVTRSNSGFWELFTSALPSANGTGAIATGIPDAASANVLQGTVADNTFSIFDDGHFGFVNVYGSGVAARAAQEFDQVQLSFTSNTLPARLANFHATPARSGVALQWQVLEEANVQLYEVQGSSNGTVFNALGSVPASGKRQYDFAAANNRFYRLRIIDVDGSASFSPIISFNARQSAALRIVRTSAGLRVEHPPAPKSVLRLINTAGKLIEERSIPPNATSTTLHFARLPNGLYYISYITPQHSITQTLQK